MPNQLKFEVKFASADLQELINLDTEFIIVSGEYIRDMTTGMWNMNVRAQVLPTDQNVAGSETTGCPMPC